MQSFISYISGFDYTILHAVQSIGPKWEPVAYFLSHGIGSYVILGVVFFLALLWIDKWRVASELFLIALVSFGIVTLLKHFFAIERPYIIDPSIIAYDTDKSFSLPSAHALMSVVILGWVALRHPKSHFIMWGVPVLVLLIGLSRVYLGVHYPSQVLAGWLFGFILLYGFWEMGQKLWKPFDKKLK